MRERGRNMERQKHVLGLGLHVSLPCWAAIRNEGRGLRCGRLAASLLPEQRARVGDDPLHRGAKAFPPNACKMRRTRLPRKLVAFLRLFHRVFSAPRSFAFSLAYPTTAADVARNKRRTSIEIVFEVGSEIGTLRAPSAFPSRKQKIVGYEQKG